MHCLHAVTRGGELTYLKTQTCWYNTKDTQTSGHTDNQPGRADRHAQIQQTTILVTQPYNTPYNKYQTPLNEPLRLRENEQTCKQQAQTSTGKLSAVNEQPTGRQYATHPNPCSARQGCNFASYLMPSRPCVHPYMHHTPLPPSNLLMYRC